MSRVPHVRVAFVLSILLLASGGPSPIRAGSAGPGWTSTPANAGAPDDRRVSRSRGTEQGVVVLWPRILPAGETAVSAEMAGAIQDHLRRLVEKALPGRPVDVRPEPERVCPQGGCRGMAVGVLLMRDENGCSLVALVSGPGRSPTRLVPWVGVVALRDDEAPFREPPENRVLVKDFTPCGEVLGRLADRDADVVAAIRAGAR